MGRRRITVAMAGAAMLAALAAPAAAHTGRFPTDISVNYSHETFRGRVTSPREVCQKDRRIYLERRDGADWSVIDLVVTENNGKFEFVRPHADGTYRVTTPRRGPFGDLEDGHNHYCRAATSPAVAV